MGEDDNSDTAVGTIASLQEDPWTNSDILHIYRLDEKISIAIASRYFKESSSEKPYDISYEECSMSGRVPVLSQCRERTREDRANQKLGILSCGCASPR